MSRPKWLSWDKPWVPVATFAIGGVVATVIIVPTYSNITGSTNNSISCSYFWQFQANPVNTMLVQAALSYDPGTDYSSRYLAEWLTTLKQQVDSPQTTTLDLQNDSRDNTSAAINSICLQLGFNPPWG